MYALLEVGVILLLTEMKEGMSVNRYVMHLRCSGCNDIWRHAKCMALLKADEMPCYDAVLHCLGLLRCAALAEAVWFCC